jgi:hypothetical protein
MSLVGRRLISLTISAALHSALAALIAIVPPPVRPAPGIGLQTIAVARLAAPKAPTAADMTTPGFGERQTAAGAPRTFVLPGFAFDVRRVRDQQHALFPFLTDRLDAIDHLREIVAARRARLTWSAPAAPRRPSSRLPPLVLSDAELMNIVDNAWSRRDRWRSFREIAALVTSHDPDDGRSAELLRTHLDQNLLQPYFDAPTRDPRFWVMLNLAADHEMLVEFAGRFIKEHPSSRASTELLFLLDEFAQASRDALLMLLATDPAADLRLTQAADPAAFELAVAIRDRYRGWLRERGLDSTAAIRRHYDTVRVRILTTIAATTPEGYGGADARFLIGEIFWDQNRVVDALRWWREIGDDERGMYRPVYTDVVREVRSWTGASAARISARLGVEYRLWLEFSQRRLSEFGYELDTF